MAMRGESQADVPRIVGAFSPLAQKMLGFGVPLGPNALITITGRKSGLPRTTPVAVVEIGERRWVIGTFGEVNWVRNLRAAGEAVITVRKRPLAIKARELSVPERAEFFRNVLGPYVRRLPLSKILLGMLNAGDVLDDPEASAKKRPVFELQAA